MIMWCVRTLNTKVRVSVHDFLILYNLFEKNMRVYMYNSFMCDKIVDCICNKI